MNDPYFDTLRKSLRSLPAADVEDIVRELRAHVDERMESMGADAALHALGNPNDIAALYLADRMVGRSTRPSVWRVLRAAGLVGGLSARGLLTLGISIVGYGFGFLFVAMALFKPFTPDRIGLWIVGGDDPGFMLGRTRAPLGEEVLGWWVIPIGAVLGALMIYLTWHVSLRALRSLIRAGLQSRTGGRGDPS